MLPLLPPLSLSLLFPIFLPASGAGARRRAFGPTLWLSEQEGHCAAARTQPLRHAPAAPPPPLSLSLSLLFRIFLRASCKLKLDHLSSTHEIPLRHSSTVKNSQ